MPDPRSVYSTLRDERRADIAQCRERQRVLGYGRIACVAAAALIVWMSLTGRGLSIAWVLAPAAAFTALLILHDRQQKLIELRQRAERYFTRALARLDGEWAGTGEPGERYLDPAHPYALDLDFFGKGSLFELVSTARSHIGEDTLARWLLHPAS